MNILHLDRIHQSGRAQATWAELGVDKCACVVAIANSVLQDQLPRPNFDDPPKVAS